MELCVKITAGDIANTLSAIHAAEIELKGICYIDEITVQANVIRTDLDKLQHLLGKRGDQLAVISRKGVIWLFSDLLKRPILLLSCMVVILASVLIPTRIFFLAVDGNETVPDSLILEKAETCGVRFGASRRAIRSEKVKNKMLNELPQLQWIGINTKGCVATIQVKEKDTGEQSQETDVRISNIVAVTDGIIRNITVTNGSQLCNIGDAVTKGQVLISGYTDCGIAIKATQASGEVYAETIREFKAVSPSKYMYRGAQTRLKRKYSVRIGKKSVNFFKDSGISPADCVKMYEEKIIALPGGYSLPLSLVCQTEIRYDIGDVQTLNTNSTKWLENACCNYLTGRMCAGTITSVDFATDLQDGFFELSVNAACIEMIGQEQCEERIQTDG